MKQDQILLNLKLFIGSQNIHDPQWGLFLPIFLKHLNFSIEISIIIGQFRIKVSSCVETLLFTKYCILLILQQHPHQSSIFIYKLYLYDNASKYPILSTLLKLFNPQPLFQKLHQFVIQNRMQSYTQSFSEPRIQDSILFDVNDQTLYDMNLTEHISRLQQMSRFLGDALNKNRSNLIDLRELVKGQISNLKNNTQILQSNIKDQTNQLKSLFEPAAAFEVKKINELKVDVSKINAEQLTTKKFVLNLQAAISHCETEIGFRELQQ